MPRHARAGTDPSRDPGGPSNRGGQGGSGGGGGNRGKTLAGYWEYGRFYGDCGGKPGKYLFPVDAEELDRLDVLNQFFLIARKRSLCSHSLQYPYSVKILDLGTGTGLWANQICEASNITPIIQIVDFNMIQPRMIPMGVQVVPFDLEEESWAPLVGDCDLVHMRSLYGSISTPLWSRMYRKIFHKLKVYQGFLEHVEIDWTPAWEGTGEYPAHSALQQWSEMYLAAMDKCGRSARVYPTIVQDAIQGAGFDDFKQQRIRCYVNSWSRDEWEKEVGLWFNNILQRGLEAMSLMPMILTLGMDVDGVKELYARAIEEINTRRFHAYFTIWNKFVWTARRPA